MGNLLLRLSNWYYDVPIVLIEREKKFCAFCSKQIDKHAVRECRKDVNLYWCSLECYKRKLVKE